MSAAEPVLTDCGLPGVKAIPYGVHMCSFYGGREELAELLAPYFAAGLRSGERCIWITAAPLHAPEALQALRARGFDADAAVAKGALIVREHGDWYAAKSELLGNQVVDAWLAEEARALAEGYSGLRITGNVTFLRDAADWSVFLEYEALVQRAFAGRRIVTLCTYPRHACGATEVLDVAQRHSCVLERPDQGWQLSIHPVP